MDIGELEEYLLECDSIAEDLVEHMLQIGANGCNIPVTVKGEDYIVSIKEHDIAKLAEKISNKEV